MSTEIHHILAINTELALTVEIWLNRQPHWNIRVDAQLHWHHYSFHIKLEAAQRYAGLQTIQRPSHIYLHKLHPGPAQTIPAP